MINFSTSIASSAFRMAIGYFADDNRNLSRHLGTPNQADKIVISRILGEMLMNTQREPDGC